MDKGPPIPLFAGEHICGSWPAHYLYSAPTRVRVSQPEVPLAPTSRPPGRLASARNWLRTGRRWAVRGELHLTDWRLVFSTAPHWSHRLTGHLSFFLVRTLTPPKPRTLAGLPLRPHLEIFHAGAPESYDRRHGFSAPEEACAALEQRLGEASKRPPVMREAFEERVAEAWWRAGLGLLSETTRASLPGPFSTGPEGDSYRARGAEPPDFELLRVHLQGVEGEGLLQLRWLFAPPSQLPLFPPWILPAEVVRGRPLRVGDDVRQGRRRSGGGWA